MNGKMSSTVTVANAGADKNVYTSADRPKLAFLDPMRAGLAFWVFWGHLAVLCRFNVPLLSAPGAAVDGFMLISGFLMVYTTKKTLGKAVSSRHVLNFYITRFFRIAPLYYLMLLVCGVTAEPWEATRDEWWQAVVGNPGAHLEPVNGLATPLGVLAHLTFVFGLVPSLVASVAMPDWSLSLEMQFYLLFPLLCAVGYSAGARMVALALLSTVAAVALPRYMGLYTTPGEWVHFVQPSPIVLKLNVFLAGMLTANWFMNGAGFGARDRILLLLSLLCLASVKPIVWVVFALFCYLLKYPASRLARMLSARVFGRLGDWSYGVYLVHIFAIVPALSWMNRAWQIAAWAPWERFAVAMALCSVLVVGASALLHVLVEQPGIKWGRRLLAKE